MSSHNTWMPRTLSFLRQVAGCRSSPALVRAVEKIIEQEVRQEVEEILTISNTPSLHEVEALAKVLERSIPLFARSHKFD